MSKRTVANVAVVENRTNHDRIKPLLHRYLGELPIARKSAGYLILGQSDARALYIKSVSIGIIPISLLDLCADRRQSIVICGRRNSVFLTADEGRLTQINADELYDFRLHRRWLTVDWILRPTMLPDLVLAMRQGFFTPVVLSDSRVSRNV